MPGVAADWYKAAVAATPGFETTGDPYLGVAGDFDGMGISCGALQWNLEHLQAKWKPVRRPKMRKIKAIEHVRNDRHSEHVLGSGSLRPMVVAVGKAKVQGAMPDFGAQLWQACTGTVKAGFTIVRGWQKGIKLQAKPRAELRALLDLPAMRAEQDKRFQVIASRALAQAEQWHKDGGATPVSKRLFCWFFDLLTQNGGLEWRNKASADQLELLCLSYLRSGLSDPKRRHVVLNRKGTIAMGTGWVNGGHWNLTVLND